MQIWQSVTNCLDGNSGFWPLLLERLSSLMHLTLNPALILPQGRGFEHLNSNNTVLSNKVIKVHFLLPDDGYKINPAYQGKNYDHSWKKVGPSDTRPAWHLLLTPPRSLKCLSGRWLYFLWLQLFTFGVIFLFVGRIIYMKLGGQWAKEVCWALFRMWGYFFFYSSFIPALPLPGSGWYSVGFIVHTETLLKTLLSILYAYFI